MIFIQINGVEFTGFSDASVSLSFQRVANQFSITFTANGPIEKPIRVNDKCIISIDGETVITGFVEKLQSNYSSSEHTINVQGRDKTADLVDSTIKTPIKINGTVSLIQLAQIVIKNIQSDIQVTSEIDVPSLKPSDIVAAKVGQGAFDFIEQYCRKRQIIATTDGLGDLVFTRANQQKVASVYLLNEIGGTKNNILSGNLSIDHSGRFNRYIIFSQGNAVGEVTIDASVTPQQMSDRSGISFDKDIRASRQLCKIAENSSDKKQCQERSDWEENIRIGRSFSYTVTVPNHTVEKTGEVWTPNMLVRVIDDYADLNTNLLVSDISFN